MARRLRGYLKKKQRCFSPLAMIFPLCLNKISWDQSHKVPGAYEIMHQLVYYDVGVASQESNRLK